MAAEPAMQQFRNRLRGELLAPDDAGYHEARRIFNTMIDKRPALIARCTSTEDVIASVQFAREHDLVVAVRGGGHNVAGKAVCDDGLMIDLSPMKGLQVDPARRTVRAEPGLTLGEFDRETQAFGLATTLGIVSRTGIAGLTLGGGLGWLLGKYGMACDNLTGVEIVTAEGLLRTANAHENQDLFWGVRGGGGNFGIVTGFEYRLHPVGSLLAGPVIHPIEKAKEVLRFYRDFTATAPDELTAFAALMPGPEGKDAAFIVVCYCGSATEGEELLKPVRRFGPPVADLIQPMPYVEVQRQLDSFYAQGYFHYWKSCFLRELSDAAIETIVAHTSAKPTPWCHVAFEHFHGAARRIPPTETAFVHRHHDYDFLIIAMSPDPADSEKNARWAREFFEAMQSYSAGRVYVNYLGEEGEERIREAYGPNYDRLVALKKKYDSANFFRLNQNIKPAAS